MNRAQSTTEQVETQFSAFDVQSSVRHQQSERQTNNLLNESSLNLNENASYSHYIETHNNPLPKVEEESEEKSQVDQSVNKNQSEKQSQNNLPSHAEEENQNSNEGHQKEEEPSQENEQKSSWSEKSLGEKSIQLNDQPIPTETKTISSNFFQKNSPQIPDYPEEFAGEEKDYLKDDLKQNDDDEKSNSSQGKGRGRGRGRGNFNSRNQDFGKNNFNGRGSFNGRGGFDEGKGRGFNGRGRGFDEGGNGFNRGRGGYDGGRGGFDGGRGGFDRDRAEGGRNGRGGRGRFPRENLDDNESGRGRGNHFRRQRTDDYSQRFNQDQAEQRFESRRVRREVRNDSPKKDIETETREPIPENVSIIIDSEEKPEDRMVNLEPEGQKYWPEFSFYVLRSKISITFKNLQKEKADVLVIPCFDKSFKVFPGSILNASPFNYREKLSEKNFYDNNKAGEVCLQKCVGIANFNIFAFINIGKVTNKIEKCVENLFELLMRLKTPIKEVVFPFSMQMNSSLLPILARAVKGLESMKNSSLTRLTIITKDMDAFEQGVNEFKTYVLSLIEENEISAEF